MTNKRVFIIHGWDGHPNEGWYPWLKRELEKNSFEVFIPTMPNSAEPKIESWILHLKDAVGEVDENTFFVGHSIGCQTVLRYLENLPIDKKIGGAVFVAGWFTLQNLTEEDYEIANPWLGSPIDFEKVKSHSNKFFALLSDNDPFVPLENEFTFAGMLEAKTEIQHHKGHFNEAGGVKEIPVVLEKILNFSES